MVFKKNNLHIILLLFSAVTLVSVLALIYLLFDARVRTSLANATCANPASSEVQRAVNEVAGQEKMVPNIRSTDPAVTELVTKVFTHILLPDDDVQIQRVVKPDELRKANPILYQYVREGDQILIYPDRAILYSPLIDKVLDIIHTPTQ